MGFEDYVSESEATSRSGVSPRTLARFVEAGYLHTEVEPDGLRLYSRKELDEIFGGHYESLTDKESLTEKVAPSAISAEAPIEGGDEISSVVATTETKQPEISDAPPKSPVVSTEAPNVIAQPIRVDPFATKTETARSHDTSVNVNHYEREIVRLKNIIKAHETLLDARDAEVQDLKDQREWLKARVERLEEKGERDQILLLSEAQTIRKLITIHEHKKSAVKQFLNWIGLVPETTVSQGSLSTEIIKTTEARPSGGNSGSTQFQGSEPFGNRRAANEE
jgi:predicted site-specific integrase-resolvase